jgi:hypothetical protein
MGDYDEDALSNKYDDDYTDYAEIADRYSDYVANNIKVVPPKPKAKAAILISAFDQEINQIFKEYEPIVTEKFMLNYQRSIYEIITFNLSADTQKQLDLYLASFKEELKAEILAEREVDAEEMKKGRDEVTKELAARDDLKDPNPASTEIYPSLSSIWLPAVAFLGAWLFIHIACTHNIKSCASPVKNAENNIAYSCTN